MLGKVQNCDNATIISAVAAVLGLREVSVPEGPESLIRRPNLILLFIHFSSCIGEGRSHLCIKQQLYYRIKAYWSELKGRVRRTELEGNGSTINDADSQAGHQTIHGGGHRQVGNCQCIGDPCRDACKP